MAIYYYAGLSKKENKKVENVIEADNELKAISLLNRQGIFVTKISKKKKIDSNLFKLSSFINDTNSRLVFTQQLASLLTAGFNIGNALQVMSKSANSKLRPIILKLYNTVLEGNRLYQGLELFPKLFPSFYINLVKSGEYSGSLDSILSRLVTNLERQIYMRSKLNNAMIYPIILVVISIAIVVILMTLVVSKIITLFTSTGQDLPWPTKLLIACNDFFANNWVTIIIVTIAMIVFFIRFIKTNKGRLYIENVYLKLPILGELIKQVITERVLSSLSLLLSSGINILEAVNISGYSSGFLIVENAMLSVKDKITDGKSLASSLQETKLIKDLAIPMVHAGETGGNLEFMLQQSANYYHKQLQKQLDKLLALLEPVIILVMGSLVGFIAIAIMLPIFQMNQLIQQ